MPGLFLVCAFRYKLTITIIYLIGFTIMEFHNRSLKKTFTCYLNLEEEISKSFELQPQIFVSYVFHMTTWGKIL